MGNVEQMSFLEVAVEVLAENNAPMSVKDIIAKVLEAKGVEDPEMEIGAKLYADMIASSKFVYMGEDKWNLKDAESLAEFEKDASEFNTADIKSKTKLTIEEMSGEKEKSQDEDGDDADDDSSDEKIFDEDAYAENSEYDEESTGDYEDDSEFDRETDDPNDDVEDFDEDKYNEYMDEYEDEYDK